MIEIRGLSYSIRKKEILKDIQISFDRGIYGLLGPNGAGKTTLLRCLTGVYPTKNEAIFVGGEAISANPDYVQGLGYLPQKFGLYKNMTVHQILQLFAETKKIPKGEQEAAIDDVLEAVRLMDRKEDKAGTLSGGMMRRVGIAQALLGDPEIVLLDEPTAGLDPEERIHFKNVLARLAKRDILVIISTHIVEDVSYLCDKIAIMQDGHFVENATNTEIAALAAGCVYLVPEAKAGELVEPYFISRKTDGGLYVLSPCKQPGEPAEPGIEEGYLCKIKGFV